VWKLRVQAKRSLFNATNPTLPRLNATWCAVPVTQFACGWPAAAARNFTILEIGAQRCTKSHATLICAWPLASYGLTLGRSASLLV